ncbi:phage major capsid protein [Arthrobacter sp. CP30]
MAHTKTAERAELLRKAQTIIDGAKASNRDFTATEEKQVEGYFTEIEKIDEWAAAAKKSDATMARLTAFGGEGPGDRERHNGLGFDATEVKNGLSLALRQKSSYGFNMPFRKEAITSASVSQEAIGNTVVNVPPGSSATALRELFDQQTTANANIKYYVMGQGSGAAIVPEGGLKPELSFDLEPKELSLDKIAVRFTYTDELSQDATFLISYILKEATRSVLLEENRLVLAKLSAAAGALTSTGAKAQAIDTIAGAIGAAEASNGLSPTRIIANPLDIAAIRTLKSTGSGEYTMDPLSGTPSSVHGVPLTSTPAIPAGTMYLTTPGLGVFYSHTSGLRVESGFATGDWEHNRVSTRVEERVHPAIIQPTYLTKITLTA